jgi:excisionase family DNA binding protein
MDSKTLIDQLAAQGFIALVPTPRPEPPVPKTVTGVGRRWYTVREVADMLGFGLSKTKMLIAMREIRSIKDGKYRRILPEWVDDYIARRVEESERVA